MSNVRDAPLDLMRGLAILMMIAFHFLYDLDSFGFIDVPLFSHWIPIAWRYLIVFLFLSAVGISLVLAHGKQLNSSKFFKRLMLLGLAALTVSFGTYIMFENAWVYFGILHLIWVSSIISIFFVKLPKVSLLLAIAILFGAIFDLPNLGFIVNIAQPYLPQGSIDYYPLFPWLSFVLIGIYLGHHPFYRMAFTFRMQWLEILGRHALIIYLIHQVVLFGLVSFVYYLLNS